VRIGAGGDERAGARARATWRQYWLLLEGYDGAKGAWDLDVRVLPP
jgi:hypothetical protein